MNNEDIGNPRHHSPSISQRKHEKRRTKETKMPLPLFESTDEAPSKGSLFLAISLLVFASSADSITLLRRLDESPFNIISI